MVVLGTTHAMGVKRSSWNELSTIEFVYHAFMKHNMTFVNTILFAIIAAETVYGTAMISFMHRVVRTRLVVMGCRMRTITQSNCLDSAHIPLQLVNLNRKRKHFENWDLLVRILIVVEQAMGFGSG